MVVTCSADFSLRIGGHRLKSVLHGESGRNSALSTEFLVGSGTAKNLWKAFSVL